MKKIREAISKWWDGLKDRIIRKLGGVPGHTHERLMNALSETLKCETDINIEMSKSIADHLDIIVESIPWTESQHWIAKKRGYAPMPDVAKKQLIDKVVEHILPEISYGSDKRRKENTAVCIIWRSEKHVKKEPENNE